MIGASTHGRGSGVAQRPFAGAPQLRSVVLLKHFNLSHLVLPWSQLTSIITGRITLDMVTDILREATVIRNLKCTLRSTKTALRSVPPLFHLQSLVLHDGPNPYYPQKRLLDVLTTPALGHLSVSEHCTVPSTPYVFYSSDGGGHPFIFGAREICGTRLPAGEGHRDQCMSVATIATLEDSCRTSREICGMQLPAGEGHRDQRLSVATIATQKASSRTHTATCGIAACRLKTQELRRAYHNHRDARTLLSQELRQYAYLQSTKNREFDPRVTLGSKFMCLELAGRLTDEIKVDGVAWRHTLHALTPFPTVVKFIPSTMVPFSRKWSVQWSVDEGVVNHEAAGGVGYP
ncbi:hypothetical protein C8J57DRAFT_1257726 [Mycena rebaudengoi]|nr:hypothetical protein C8J57DRAFT_1257726 [Mycena rebaudengoi]